MIRTLTPAMPRSTTSLLARARASWPTVIAAFESPWVAYPLLLLLQLKMIWGVWAVRDVTTGDTAYYFMEAWEWFTEGEIHLAWSPLYTAFYGSFLFVNSDPVWATFAHRVVIVLAAAFMVLAVMRQLLPAGIAWLCAAWWAVLPIVFNTLYEVHLFSAIPVLAAWWLLLTAKTPWRRAASLGLFAASTVLVRNELSVPTAVLGLVLVGYELRRWRQGEGMRSVFAAYATAGVAVVGLCFAAYETSRIKYPLLAQFMQEKHTLNMAQVYAFGYQQRHPEWTASPWTESGGLMAEHFGKPLLTLREMIAANPRAVAEHFAWNVSLTPNGLQLLLFNRVAGSVIPDYDLSLGSRMNDWRGAVLGVAVLTLWGVGFALLWRGRREWWQNWLSARSLGWVAMFAVATAVPLIILTQRPRPSYLFTFAVLLMAITGMCLHISTTRWRLAERLRSIVPLLMVGLVLFVPRYFTQAKYLTRHTAKGVERCCRTAMPSWLPGP
ncbi:MAG: hypothetical protein U0792_25455 [Gemmataceae bacterium]